MEMVPAEETIEALIEGLVTPSVSPPEKLGVPPTVDQQQMVAKQMHAAVVLYNYYHRKQFPSLQFLPFQSFCKFACISNQALVDYMKYLNASKKDVEALKNPSITEKMVLEACNLCTALDPSKAFPDIDGWPICKVAVFLVDSTNELCLLQDSSATNGFWSLIEKAVPFGKIGASSHRRTAYGSSSSSHACETEEDLEQLAFSFVNQITGINLSDLSILEDHVTYSLDHEKENTRFYIMKYEKNVEKIADKKLTEVPIADVLRSLEGPIVEIMGIAPTTTSVVDYFHILPYVELVSKWIREPTRHGSSLHVPKQVLHNVSTTPITEDCEVYKKSSPEEEIKNTQKSKVTKNRHETKKLATDGPTSLDESSGFSSTQADLEKPVHLKPQELNDQSLQKGKPEDMSPEKDETEDVATSKTDCGLGPEYASSKRKSESTESKEKDVGSKANNEKLVPLKSQELENHSKKDKSEDISHKNETKNVATSKMDSAVVLSAQVGTEHDSKPMDKKQILKEDKMLVKHQIKGKHEDTSCKQDKVKVIDEKQTSEGDKRKRKSVSEGKSLSTWEELDNIMPDAKKNKAKDVATSKMDSAVILSAQVGPEHDSKSMDMKQISKGDKMLVKHQIKGKHEDPFCNQDKVKDIDKKQSLEGEKRKIKSVSEGKNLNTWAELDNIMPDGKKNKAKDVATTKVNSGPDLSTWLEPVSSKVMNEKQFLDGNSMLVKNDSRKRKNDSMENNVEAEKKEMTNNDTEVVKNCPSKAVDCGGTIRKDEAKKATMAVELAGNIKLAETSARANQDGKAAAAADLLLVPLPSNSGGHATFNQAKEFNTIELHQATIRVLEKKRNEMRFQKCRLADELAQCEMHIQTLSSEIEGNKELNIKTITEALKTLCQGQEGARVSSEDIQLRKRRKLSEAVLSTRNPCEELDEICDANNWILQQNVDPFLENGEVTGMFKATMILQGLDFTYDSVSELKCSPKEARESAASHMISKVQTAVQTARLGARNG